MVCMCVQDMAQALMAALKHALDHANGQQSAYTYLNVSLPMMWITTGTTLAPIMAANLIECGCSPLLAMAKVRKQILV